MENTIKFSALTAEQQKAVANFYGAGYIDDHVGSDWKYIPQWEELAIYRREGYPDRLTIIPNGRSMVSKVCLNEVYLEGNNVHLSSNSIGGVYYTYEDYSDSLGGEVIRIIR